MTSGYEKTSYKLTRVLFWAFLVVSYLGISKELFIQYLASPSQLNHPAKADLVEDEISSADAFNIKFLHMAKILFR